MNDPRRQPRPGLPQRGASTETSYHGLPATVPADRRPRVPPNDQSFGRNRAQTSTQPPRARPQDQPDVDGPVQDIGESEVPQPRTEATRSTARQEDTPDHGAQALGSEYERVGLPSQFAFYPWSGLSIRRVAPFDHAKITRAGRHRNLSLMLDAVAATTNRDPRDLAVSDFYALCHWQKANGYPGSPTQVSWNSKYGGRPENRVRKTRLQTTKLDRTREDYLKWQERGLAIPTMRDLEMMETLADEDTAIMFEHAQFISLEPLQERVAELRRAGDSSPTITARVEELNKRGNAFFATCSEFSDAFANFGVQEFATVTNGDATAQSAITSLRERGRAEDLTEADEIARCVAENRAFVPQPEEVPLVFDLWSLFPYQ